MFFSPYVYYRTERGSAGSYELLWIYHGQKQEEDCGRAISFKVRLHPALPRSVL